MFPGSASKTSSHEIEIGKATYKVYKAESAVFWLKTPVLYIKRENKSF